MEAPDLTAQDGVDNALSALTAHSEQQRRFYDAVLSSTPDLIYVFDLNHRFIYANKAFLEMQDKRWEEMVGKNCLELGYEPWLAETHDREIEHVIATKRSIRGEVPYTGTHGRRIYDYIFVPVIGADGDVEAVAGTTRDVTERKHFEERQEFLLQLSDAVRPLTDPDAVKAAASRLLGEHLEVNRCFYAEVEGNDWIVEGSYSNSSSPLPPGRYEANTYGQRIMEMYRAGKKVVFRDSRTDPTFSPEEREAHLAISIISAIGVSLLKDGKLVAILAVHSAEPRNWTQEEISLVEETAERTWSSVQRARSEASLRDSETSFRVLTESLPQLVWTCLPDGRCDYLSRQWVIYTGLPESEQLDLNWLDRVIHPEDQKRTREHWLGAVAGHHAYDIEFRIRRADGAYRWFQTRGVPLHDEHGRIARWFGSCTDITHLKQVDERNHFLLRLDDAIRPLTDPAEITKTAATLLGQHLKVNRCAYADVEADEDTFNLTGDYTDGVETIVGRYTFTQFGTECVQLMREGKPYVVSDSETDPRTYEVRASYRLTEIRAVICVSMLKRGRFVAAMAVHQNTPREWHPEEVELVQQIAARCWESIERARIAREMEQRGQRYRFLAESIPQMVWTADAQGALSYVNGQVTQYFSTKASDVLGSGWLNWVHPEDHQHALERWHASIQSGEPYETVFRLRRESDGTWRWHLVRAHPLIGAAGKVVEWFGTCTDIEDQKRAETELKEQWHTFDTALSHTPDFTYIFDLQGRFTYVNQALLYLWQIPFEEAIGKNFYELQYPPELAERLQNQIQQVISSKEPVKDSTPFTGPTGETRQHEYIFVPVFGPNGEVRVVAGSTRDTTDRDRIEQALAASEQKLQQVFSQAPVAIITFRGKDFVVELANPSYQSLVPGRNLVGQRFRDAVPELQEDVWEAFNQVFMTGEPFVANEWLVPYDQDGDGVVEEHWFNCVYHPLREASGEVTGVIAVFADVTTGVRNRLELERANRELEEFAYVASHDLQEPLRMINIYGQMLIRRFAKGDETALKYGGFIEEGISRMENLLRDLLIYSRTTHREEVTKIQCADLSASLEEAKSVLGGRIQDAGAVIISDPLPKVLGETGQLAHVFQNLLSNALKYRTEKPPEIHIRAQREGDMWTISVQDNGIGFEQKYAHRIFGLFKRLHKDEYPGTGLGLAICHRIIERCGGRMWAESKVGQGSTFFFLLPKWNHYESN